MTFPLKTIGILKSKGADTSFKTTINTALGTGASIDLRTILPDTYTYDFTVFWGDGGSYSYTGTTPSTDPNLNYSYSVDGTYQLSFSGKVGGWSINNGAERLKFISVDQWGTPKFDFISGGFHGASNLTVVEDAPIDVTSSVTNLLDLWRSSGLTRTYTRLYEKCSLVITINGLHRTGTSLLTIDSGVFDYFTNVELAGNVFLGCINVGNPPADLLRYMVNVTDLIQFHQNNYNISALPNNYFFYNKLVTSYQRTLENCRNIVLPPVLFDLSVLNIVTTFFEFAETAEIYSFTGAIQDVWNYATSAISTNAFLNQTSLTNYASIPNSWKGL